MYDAFCPRLSVKPRLPPFWQLAQSSADNFPALTVSHFITANLLPVMLGNIIGGASAGDYFIGGDLRWFVGILGRILRHSIGDPDQSRDPRLARWANSARIIFSPTNCFAGLIFLDS